MAKYDPAGNLLWAKSIGGIGEDQANSIAIDAFGNIYITGKYAATVDFAPDTSVFHLSTSIPQEVFVAKYNNSGNLIWAKSMEGDQVETGYGITVDGMGNVYTVGEFGGTCDFDPGAGVFTLTNLSSIYDDVFISKLDASGNFVWAKTIGGPSYDEVRSVKLDINNNLYVSGWFKNTVDFDPGAGSYNITASGNEDLFVLKLNSLGDFIWPRHVGGSAAYVNCYSLTTDNFGNTISTGTFMGTADFNTGSGAYNLSSAGSNSEMFILKLDSLGTFVWANYIGGGAGTGGFSVGADASGNIYTTGYFADANDFDSGPGLYSLSSTTTGYTDAFICKVNTAGNLMWAVNLGGNSADIATSIAVDINRNAVITGSFNSPSVFVNATSSLTHSAASPSDNNDFFVAKYLTNYDGIPESSRDGFALFPNPFKDEATINFNEEQHHSVVRIMDVLGKEIQRIDFTGQQLRIEKGNMKEGVYFIQISDQRNNVMNKKMIIQ